MRNFTLLVLATLLGVPSALPAQAPPDALDAAWVAVCAGAQPGSAFFQRCQEILDAGPGSADRRSEAALGNNLGQLPAQTGNASERRAGGSAEEAVYRATDGRLGWFLFAGSGDTERRAGPLDAGFDGDLRRFGLGLDYRLGDHLVLGALLSRLDADRRFPGGGGRADSRVRAVTAFLDWHSGGRLGGQAYAGYGDIDLVLERRVRYSLLLNAGTPEQSTVQIDALASARPGGRQSMLGGALSWDFSDGAFGRGLRLGSDWSRTRIGAFSESGGAGLALTRSRSARTSHTVSLGLDASWTASTASGVIVPYLRLDWIHELEDDDCDVAVSFAGDAAQTPIRFQRERGERSFGEAALGVSAVLPGGLSGFLEYERMFANRQLDHHMFTLGLRIER
jgi:uncharacterized protein with beta-barrel porin domain